MSIRDRVLDAPEEKHGEPARNPDDVIAGLLMSAQASIAAAMTLLGKRATAPTDEPIDPNDCPHPPDKVRPIGGFGDDPGQRFCTLCGAEIE